LGIHTWDRCARGLAGFFLESPKESRGRPHSRQVAEQVLRAQAREILGKIEAAGPRRSEELRRGRANDELAEKIRAWAE
jgi:hypothetical protein